MSLAAVKVDSPAPLRAFTAFGLEIEYMIVHAAGLGVVPSADKVLPRKSWSNELVAHVVELKNERPSPDLRALTTTFQREVQAMNDTLKAHGARLMPTAMHPWMNPQVETHLWPGENAIYRAYDRIFNCRSHGWANLQSVHINLPFADDAEFARLHAAVRLILPIIPALAASSPFVEGRPSGWVDYRLHAYDANSRRIPEMNGELIPDPVESRAQYGREVLAPLYRALQPHDPEGLLQDEWANARGAIARFDRSALEIRLMDSQECPAADVAIASAVIDAVRHCYEHGAPALPTADLARHLRACMRDGDLAAIEARYAEALVGAGHACTAGELWGALAERMHDAPHRPIWQPVLDDVVEHGPLARRLLHAAGTNPSAEQIRGLYAHLCECLQDGVLFDRTSY